MALDKMLRCEGVTVSFDGFKVLDHLDFFLEYGELRFLIGPNGAGKTTLLDIITGKTRPQSGHVDFDEAGGGVNVLRHEEHEIVRRGAGRKFQTPSIFPSLSVFENVTVARSHRRGLFGLFRSLSGPDNRRVLETLDLVGLVDRRDAHAGALSHGEKQWLEIAMLLVQEPKLLLLDEPVAGMTRRERERTGELLHAVAGDRSVLVVEHDMQFVRQFSRTVTVLHLGKVLSEGPMDKIQQDPRVIEAYLGHNKARELQEAAHA